MRLLHIHTWQFHELYDNPPPYIITSHRWTAEELTFQELKGPSLPSNAVNKSGYQKVLGFCKAIQRLMELCPKLQVEYLWIDTCCIDKTNSVELQEALNSMFRWYAEAEVCLAYLPDVDSLDQHPGTVIDSFKSSIWHKRGWCLQELLAPKRILFYNRDWEILGRKRTVWQTPWLTAKATGLIPLNGLLAEITGVPSKILWDFSTNIEELSIEEKRAWMNGRSTTRVEDKVYCQLGIFGVFMPLIYGEGEYAMIRLAEAVSQKQRRQVGQLKSSPANSRSFSIHYSSRDGSQKIVTAWVLRSGTGKDLSEIARRAMIRNGSSVDNAEFLLRASDGTVVSPDQSIANLSNDLQVTFCQPGETSSSGLSEGFRQAVNRAGT